MYVREGLPDLIVIRENLPLCPRFGDKLELKQKIKANEKEKETC